MPTTSAKTLSPKCSQAQKPKVQSRSALCRALLLAPFILQACGVASTHVADAPMPSGQFIPVALKDGRSAEPATYQGDRQACWTQIRSENNLDMTEAVNVMRFRSCLIKRGYLLMS
jgi:hypothetical protein